MFMRRKIVLCDPSEDFGSASFDLVVYNSREDYERGCDPIWKFGSTDSFSVAEAFEYLFNRIQGAKIYDQKETAFWDYHFTRMDKIGE